MQGKRFGKLVVNEEAERKHGKRRWHCRCDCGTELVVWQDSLNRAGQLRSCGCGVSDIRKERWAEYREPAFWARVDMGDKASCWNWTGLAHKSPKNPTPYGVLGWRGKVSRAHRVAYELVNGEIPAKAMVLHECDNTLCCNPDHLYLGDHHQNMRDVVERKRNKGHPGAQNGRAKLTQEQADAIRVRYAAGGISQQAIADEIGISQFAVSAIVRNERYV